MGSSSISSACSISATSRGVIVGGGSMHCFLGCLCPQSNLIVVEAGVVWVFLLYQHRIGFILRSLLLSDVVSKGIHLKKLCLLGNYLTRVSLIKGFLSLRVARKACVAVSG